jgi:hypothetical protein
MSSSLDKFSDKLCLQRKANGDPCHSPALHGERFCHFHKLMGKPAINMDNSPSGHAYLPVFEDAVSIQSAITDVCEMMLHRRIEPKEASILLYAMQVASTNMAHMNGDNGKRNGKSQNKNPENHPEPAALSAPDSLPPGTIQARAQKGRRKLK